MTRDRWIRLVEALNADIVGLVKAQRVRDEVHEAIRTRVVQPSEEQLIDADCFDLPMGQPQVFTVANTRIKLWKIHRAGLRSTDVKGADLFYEISDKKFVVVQYKTPDGRGRVTHDAEQLAELQSVCPVECPPPSDRFKCGAWFALRSAKLDTHFPACEAQEVFGLRKSRKSNHFLNGLSITRFREDFGICHLGARTQPVDVDAYQERSVQEDKLFVHVEQSR